MLSTSRTHSELVTSLVDSAFELRPLARWDQLLRESERLQGGAVLFDLDEAERSPGLRALGISAHRLIHLLAREFKHGASALVLVTTRDYAEIEDLMREGVHALVHPRSALEWRVAQVHLAANRRRAAALGRGDAQAAPRDLVATAPARLLALPAPAEPTLPAALAEPTIVPTIVSAPAAS